MGVSETPDPRTVLTRRLGYATLLLGVGFVGLSQVCFATGDFIVGSILILFGMIGIVESGIAFYGLRRHRAIKY